MLHHCHHSRFQSGPTRANSVSGSIPIAIAAGEETSRSVPTSIGSVSSDPVSYPLLCHAAKLAQAQPYLNDDLGCPFGPHSPSAVSLQPPGNVALPPPPLLALKYTLFPTVLPDVLKLSARFHVHDEGMTPCPEYVAAHGLPLNQASLVRAAVVLATKTLRSTCAAVMPFQTTSGSFSQADDPCALNRTVATRRHGAHVSIRMECRVLLNLPPPPLQNALVSAGGFPVTSR